MYRRSICCVCGVLSLLGCSSPNTTSTGFLGLDREPNHGYVWENPDSLLDYSVIWAPGSRYLDLPNMSAGVEEGAWEPDAGYTLEISYSQPEGVIAIWTEGLANPYHPNVYSGSDVNSWVPAPGYRFVSNDSLEVVPLSSASNSQNASGAAAGIAAIGGLICLLNDNCREFAGDVVREVAVEAAADSLTN